MNEIEKRVLSTKWFYHFKLPSGAVTEVYIPEEIAGIHSTREQMMGNVLDPLFGGRWSETTAVDLACHEGYFSIALAQRGCKRVLGIDAREEHIRDAELIRSAYGLPNLEFRTGDVTKFDPAEVGQFDIVLMFGLIYHLENPIAALRVAHALTRRVCLIETQIAPNLDATVEWGSQHFVKPTVGVFAVVDEWEDLHGAPKQAGLADIALVPSLEAVLWIMKRAGFTRVEVVPPPPDSYEQLARGQRVIVAGYID
ncbi:MAG TPA: class I SAM-dependent methyltransferase [Thermoanaerobaculia bacterium]|nr:class I SAM-dependent methyltransferase [Thermoanaerobaculia bacterium]